MRTQSTLSKYEAARVVGLRALQLSEESSLSLEAAENEASLELVNRKLEAIIRRWLPTGDWEDVNINELLLTQDIMETYNPASAKNRLH